jgi:outer membrane biosynthesis protein TonB
LRFGNGEQYFGLVERGGFMAIALILAAAVAAGLAVFYQKKRQAAEQQARRSDNTLNDFMAAELAMKASQLECYKAMLRQPNPQSQAQQPQQQPQQQSPPRNNPRGIDWEYISDDNPRRRF